VTQQEIAERLILIRAATLGWAAPDYPESLDQLIHEAEQWLDRWVGGESLVSSNNAATAQNAVFKTL